MYMPLPKFSISFVMVIHDRDIRFHVLSEMIIEWTADEMSGMSALS